MAHEYYLADARDLVEAGVAGFLHSVRDAEMDDALVARMKKELCWPDVNFLQPLHHSQRRQRMAPMRSSRRLVRNQSCRPT
jgi:hypothetical protein